MIGYQDQPDHTRWYVSDLPGHIGTARALTAAGRKADWGFSPKREQAIDLSPYWQRRFLAYYRGIPNRQVGLLNPFAG